MRCAAKLDRLKCYLLINFFQLVFRSFIRKGLMDRTEGWSKGQDSVWGIFYSESTTVSTSGGWKPGPRDVPRAISFPSAKGCFRIAEPFPPVPGPKRKVVRAFCGPAKGCREGVSEAIFDSESTTVPRSGGWKPGPRDVPRAISFPSAKGCFRIAEPFPPVPGPKRKVVRAFCGPAKGCREGVSEW